MDLGVTMNRVTRFLFVILAIVILSACSQNQPTVEPEPQPKDEVVKLVLHSEQTVASGMLALAVDVEGEAVNKIELLRDDQVFATLKSPFTYTWDTSKEKEGNYSFQARVTQEKTFLSKMLEITVDRTAPSIKQAMPLDSSHANPISVVFSEPVDAATVTSSHIFLKNGDRAVETTISLSNDGLSLNINPEVGSIGFPATLSLSLKGIKDLAGNRLKDVSYNWDLSYWVTLKGSLNQDLAKSVATSHMTFDSKNYPVVLFSEDDPEIDIIAPSQVYVKRWTGSDWQLLGSRINSEFGHASTLQIIMDPSDNPIIAYSENASVDDAVNGVESKVYIKQWTGSVWKLVMGMDAPSYGFSNVYLKPDGKHILKIWEPDLLTVKQWSGSAWTTLKTVPVELLPVSSSSNISVYDTSVVLDANNNPVVAWVEYDALMFADFKLYVQRWTGSAWEAIGNQALNVNSNAYMAEVLLNIDKNNNPVLAWTEVDSQEDSSTRQLYMKRWTGSAWESLDEGSINMNKAKHAVPSSLSFDPQGNPVLSWNELGEVSRSYAKALIDNKWQLIGGKSLNINPQRDARGVISFSGQGIPFVAVSELVNGVYQLFVQEANH
jgi:hypothetical protein